MDLIPTKIRDVIVIQPKVHGDNRGFFMETWREEDFKALGIGQHFVQENHSKSRGGILRGLHYQVKKPQGKLIRVVAGEIFDVAVDIRPGSASFGQWVGEYISAENKRSIWVPPGFAHGFYVTGDSAEVTYRCTEYYAPEHERSLLWNDPDINIDWPLKGEPVLSDKDRNAPTLAEAELPME